MLHSRHETERPHLDYLFGLERRGIKLGLGPTTELLRRCGDPQSDLSIVQIAGTNGKGTTAALTARILQEHGRRVGLFTSPHLLRLHERIRVDGAPIEDGYIIAWLDRQRPDIEAIPATFFEAITALALCYFSDRQVDVAVLETGLGGRLDSTTATIPSWTALTPIAMDHMDMLGDTLEAIAREKAGILKPGVPCYSAQQRPEVEAVIRAEAQRAAAPVIDLDPHEQVPQPRNLAGAHQHANARLAWALTQGILGGDFDSGRATRAVAATIWPGRYQQLGSHPKIIYDVAHNPHGMAAFLGTLAAEPVRGRRRLVLALQEGKGAEELLSLLLPVFDAVTFTQTETRHFIPAAHLAKLAAGGRHRTRTEPNPIAAIAAILSEAGQDDLVVILGSHYLGPAVAEVFKISFDNL